MKFFGVSDDPFTNNTVTTVMGSIAGNVFRDPHGNINNYVDGTGINNPSSTQLYVSAINSSGAVVKTVAADADGTYEIVDLPNGTYTMKVHTSPAGSTTSAMPGGWYNTGEHLGSGSGHDGSVDGSLSGVVVADSLIRHANFGIFTSPLAVSWRSINAEMESGLGAIVSWSTSSEENSYYFEIERSVDGASFEVIGEVEAAGNSQSVLTYKFVDYDALNFKNINVAYRIKQVDFDLKYDFSQVAIISLKDELQLDVYPNPSVSSSIVRLGNERLNISDVRLMDMSGTRIEALTSRGDGTLELNAQSLRSGVYLLSIQTSGRNIVKRIVVQH